MSVYKPVENPKKVPIQTRSTFLRNYIPEPNSGCWLWQQHCNVKGYGNTRWQGKMMLAHRVSFMIHSGDIPDKEIDRETARAWTEELLIQYWKSRA